MAEPDAFAKLLAYIEKEADNLKVLQLNTLKDCLVTGKANSKREGDSERFKHYKIYLALERKMSAEQRRVIEEWERRNCAPEGVRVGPAFRKFFSIAEHHLEEMKALRRATLSEVCSSYVAQNNHVWGGVCRTFVMKHPYETLNEQEKEKWNQLEERICVKETALQ